MRSRAGPFDYSGRSGGCVPDGFFGSRSACFSASRMMNSRWPLTLRNSSPAHCSSAR